MIGKHGTNTHWFSISLSQTSLNKTYTSTCFIESLSEKNKLYIKNILTNFDIIFYNAYKFNKIKLSDVSVSSPKYWL